MHAQIKNQVGALNRQHRRTQGIRLGVCMCWCVCAGDCRVLVLDLCSRLLCVTHILGVTAQRKKVEQSWKTKQKTRTTSFFFFPGLCVCCCSLYCGFRLFDYFLVSLCWLCLVRLCLCLCVWVFVCLCVCVCGVYCFFVSCVCAFTCVWVDNFQQGLARGNSHEVGHGCCCRV